jgi:hypothetical protein
MTSPRFDQFFKLEVRIPEAHDYQQRLAGFHVGTGCKPQFITVPTSLDKTPAVVLTGFWNRVQIQNPKWPRRLKAEDEQQRTPYHPQIGREDQELVVGGLSIQHEFRPELLSRNNGEGLSNSPVAGQSRHKTQNSNGAYYE